MAFPVAGKAFGMVLLRPVGAGEEAGWMDAWMDGGMEQSSEVLELVAAWSRACVPLAPSVTGWDGARDGRNCLLLELPALVWGLEPDPRGCDTRSGVFQALGALIQSGCCLRGTAAGAEPVPAPWSHLLPLVEAETEQKAQNLVFSS